MTTFALSAVGHELLDDPAADPAAVAESLRHIARANRWLGGADAVRFGLMRLLRDVPRGARLTLLDLGTGAGDLPGAAVEWAARRGIELVPIGLERSPVAATLARSGGVPTAVGCVSALPFAPKSVDVVLASQLAHHLAPASLVGLAGDCTRLARIGVVVADLRRSRLAALGFPIAGRLLRFDRNTLRDGVTSIRRGFRASELRALLAAAGVNAAVHARPGWRLVATWRSG